MKMFGTQLLKELEGGPSETPVVAWVPYLLSVIGRGAPLTHPTSDDWLGALSIRLNCKLCLLDFICIWYQMLNRIHQFSDF